MASWAYLDLEWKIQPSENQIQILNYWLAEKAGYESLEDWLEWHADSAFQANGCNAQAFKNPDFEFDELISKFKELKFVGRARWFDIGLADDLDSSGLEIQPWIEF